MKGQKKVFTPQTMEAFRLVCPRGRAADDVAQKLETPPGI